MLKTKEVISRWNTSNRKYYSNLGYKCSKIGDEFIVKIKDLHSGSKQPINFTCDRCGKDATSMYRTIYINKEIYKMELCSDCMKDIREDKIKNSKRNQYGICDTHEKRKQYLKEYLDTNNTLDCMTNNTIGKRLYDSFKAYKDDVYDTATELGYNLIDIISPFCIFKYPLLI